MEEKKFKLDKKTKILLIVLISYGLIMLAIFLPGYIRNKKEKIYIATNNIQIKYEKGKWSKITNIDDYKNKLFEVYEDGNYKGRYNIFYQDIIYLYTKENKNDLIEKYNGQIFTYHSTVPLNVLNPREIIGDKNDQEIINMALQEINVNENLEFNSIQKWVIDIDNDGVEETIYNVDNIYSQQPGTKVVLLFIYDDGKINVLEKGVDTENGGFGMVTYTVINVLDIRKDNKLELLYINNIYSQPDNSCITLYNLSKKKVINNFCE